MKICKSCNISKDLTEFRQWFSKLRNKYYYKNTCIKCENLASSKYQNDNKEFCLALYKKYYIKNREKVLETKKKYRNTKNGKLNRRIIQAKRRALKIASNDNTINLESIKILLEKQNSKCVYCFNDLEEYHIDHITPLSKDGKHSIKNIQLLCPTCNLSKHDKTHEEFLNLRRI